jgi:hypothetical protein
MLEHIARNGELRVRDVTGQEPNRRGWRTVEGLLDRGLIQRGPTRSEAHGMVAVRTYVLTEAGQKHLAVTEQGENRGQDRV